MEFKVRKESQSVLEKTFSTYEKQGTVRSYQIGSMLKTLRPDVTIDEQELENVISLNDPDKTGKFDLIAFNKVALHFLVKASRQDADGFSHKHLVISKDFPDSENPC
ncbi:Troponin C [Orchesella cincta]|uniref:Troponin C n=1 Tax=Orchesella cincta TaxID=48709 RepID=A0A1D2NLA6_ORCCI|nr:Troponin C [Orchesella cincta]